MSKVISKATIEEIRGANDIAEVIGTYLQLKRAGSAWKALCPFHKEKTPSFHVNSARQIYHCFGCGAGGDVFKFLMEYEGVDFSTAARMLAERAGIRVTWSDADPREGAEKDQLLKLHEEVALAFHRNLLEKPNAEKARQYLRSRDLDTQTAKDFLIGYAPPGRDTIARWGQKKGYPAALLEQAGLVVRTEQGDTYDRFRDRLMFPIRNELGRVVAFSGRILEKSDKLAKYVNSPETPVFRKGRILYALDRAKRHILDAKTAILCEGQIDVIRCHVAGVNTAVAAQGTALTEDHARLLKRYGDAVVIVLDADKAGQDASLRSADVLVAAGLSASIASLPPGEDPDSLIRKQGAKGFLDVVAGARSVLEFQIGVLRSRENMNSEAGVMRVARAVLETIRRAPTAVQRDQMVRQAARELKIGEDALREDLNRQVRKPGRAEGGEPEEPTARAVHPPEEVALAELLAQHDDVTEIVRAHLPLDVLSDAACRAIVRRLLERPADGAWNLLGELADEDDECRRLAAEVQMSPPKCGKEFSPADAARDAILVIRRKSLERRREELRRQMERAEVKDRERLGIEVSHLTMDIKQLQQGWEKALPILEL